MPFGKPRQPAEPAAGDPTGTDETEDLSRLGSIHLLPQSLSVDSQVLAQRRSRGIYQALTYEADTRFTGRFSPPDLAALSIPSPDWLRWKGAQLKIYVAKLEATRLAEEIVWNGRRLPLRFDRDAGERGAILTADLAAAAPAGDWKADFAFEIAVNGSEGIGFQLLA